MKYSIRKHFSRRFITIIFVFMQVMASLLNVYSTAYANSTGVVLARVQTGGAGSGTASQELVSLYNATDNDVDITNWCVEYSAGSNGQVFSKLSCVQSLYENIGIWLGARSWVHFGTQQFMDVTGYQLDFIFLAGMAGTSGHVRIVNSSGSEVDRLGWGAALKPEGSAAAVPGSGQVLARKLTSESIDTDNNSVDFESVAMSDFVAGGVYEAEVIEDMCANIEGLQTEAPTGLDLEDGTGLCIQLQQLEDAPLQITELYPDAVSYDTGQEFIEIYNPTDRVVSLAGYVLQVGQGYTQAATLGSGSVEPGSYIAVSDLQSGIVLPNTTASVRLVAPTGDVVSESAPYSGPSEHVSWAVVGGVWQYTNQITPGMVNAGSLEELEEANSAVDTTTGVLAACSEGKVRNPATNRCRIVGSTQSQLLSCDSDEYRNPETNRCRKQVRVAGATATCRSGQVRNTITNRCKSLSTNSNALQPCKTGQERNPETNRCRKVQNSMDVSENSGLAEVSDVAVPGSTSTHIGIIVSITALCVVLYSIYEWRNELGRAVSKLSLRRIGV